MTDAFLHSTPSGLFRIEMRQVRNDLPFRFVLAEFADGNRKS